ncbi:hypothetical protein HDU79_008524 [Rhizoclosmatium sp. JEL0117]|nr:hypothetical protein HDU79_008524 [Rhizoclosmatium sp. JEL0117]
MGDSTLTSNDKATQIRTKFNKVCESLGLEALSTSLPLLDAFGAINISLYMLDTTDQFELIVPHNLYNQDQLQFEHLFTFHQNEKVVKTISVDTCVTVGTGSYILAFPDRRLSGTDVTVKQRTVDAIANVGENISVRWIFVSDVATSDASIRYGRYTHGGSDLMGKITGLVALLVSPSSSESSPLIDKLQFLAGGGTVRLVLDEFNVANKLETLEFIEFKRLFVVKGLNVRV